MFYPPNVGQEKENITNPQSVINRSLSYFNSNKFNSTYSKTTMSNMMTERESRMETVE